MIGVTFIRGIDKYSLWCYTKENMKRSYAVTILVSTEYTLSIKAKDADEAEDIAEGIANDGILPPHGASRSIDIVKIEKL